MKLLAIESSCDDLSVCVYEAGRVLALTTATQTTIHAAYGGVVPELASREHLNTISQTVAHACQLADITPQQIDAVAATYAPGLVGSVLVGLNFAKALSLVLNKPFIGINHIEAHLHSPLLEHPNFTMPALGLVVSGGHTHLYQIHQIGEYQILGHTVDDAVGEAFDKVGKVMGLAFPGGPEIDKLAKLGKAKTFEFSFPQVKDNLLNVSYSGLKTASLQHWKAMSVAEQELRKADLAASFQDMAVRILLRMIERAIDATGIKNILLSGGVACNSELRRQLNELAHTQKLNIAYPSPKYCTDNAAMVALMADFYLGKGITSPLDLDAHAS